LSPTGKSKLTDKGKYDKLQRGLEYFFQASFFFRKGPYLTDIAAWRFGSIIDKITAG